MPTRYPKCLRDPAACQARTRPSLCARAACALLAPLLAASAGCAHNYTADVAPRYAGGLRHLIPRTSVDTLRVVSFNLEHGRRVQEATDLLRREPRLREADILLLQEMDARGTARIAAALGYAWVYYPATRHPSTGRDFGNAVLSKLPIESDRKVILPHLARIGRTQRIAVGATLRWNGRPLRVYSLHLATFAGNGPKARRQQLEAVLADADSFEYVVVGGDFNSESLPKRAAELGYHWPTRKLPPTSVAGTIDHFVTQGLTLADTLSVGVIPKIRDISDHKPIWARLVARES
ncbi:MAG TPA: endonuclease/exonuclease/phosphatase family protein [Candidatus Eisenbacteria bacterium]|nr:endonuclease/exonuclease/phosphatase family protein [Candidatus Eisenbacteria bacterium]